MASTGDRQDDAELTDEELRSQEAEPLPDREAMSLLGGPYRPAVVPDDVFPVDQLPPKP